MPAVSDTRQVRRWIALSLLTLLLAANVYRAATQSLTIDEAYTYHLYLAKNLRAILTDYDANNHVLYTLLAKFSVGLFGKGEFAMRLPSVLGGLLYFFAVYKLCRFLFGDRWLFVVAVAALTLNPFLLDFLSVARGYGLGIALWTLGLWFLLTERLERAGASFGLAVAANLTLLFPAAGLIGVYWFRSIRTTWTVVDRLILPAIVSAFAILVVPISNMKPGSFYVGAESLWTGVQTVVTMSLRHHMTVLPAIQIWLLTALFPVMLMAVLLLLRKPDEQLRLLGGALLLTIALVIAGHYAAHLGYPELRTGLYLIPFFTLVYLLAIRKRPVLWRLPVWLLIALYALQWNVSHYTEWKFDASTNKIARMIRERQPRRVGASWELTESLNYYRERYRIAKMEPVARTGPDADYDCYVLLPSDYGLISKRRLKEIYRDELSEVVLAVPAHK